MTHTLMALALVALVQSPDTSTYADPATEALIVQARGRHAYQDSLVQDYTAEVRTRIDAGFGRSRFARVPPILAHETAAKVSWSLPNNLKVDVLGQRSASTLPDAAIEIEFDRPWFIPRSLGDSIRMVDDELPATAALHPLAVGAGEYYHYAITDSLTMEVPGRTVRAIGVRVEPKALGPSLIAGTMWFDADTYEVVRLTFVFVGQYTWVSPDEPTPEDSAGARRNNTWAQRIAKLEADLEYALFDRLYWMPYRQLLQLTVDIPWFVNVKIPVRFITTFSEYAVNESVLPEFEIELDSVLEETDYGEEWRRRRSSRQCEDPIVRTEGADHRVLCNEETGYSRAGPRDEGGRWEIHYPPRDSLEVYSGWGDEIELDLQPGDEERIKESIAALGELQEQLPADWVGRMPRHFAFESFSDIFRFNRVQGVSLGGGYQIRPGPDFTTLIGTARYGFSDNRPNGSLTWRRDAPGGRLDLTAFHDVREVEPWTAGLGFGNSLNAIFAGNDDADYYLASGGGVTFSGYGRGLLRNAQFGLFFEHQRSMETVASSGINDWLGGNGEFPFNSPVNEGDFVRAYANRRSFVGPVELQQGVEGLFGDEVLSTRLWGAARWPFAVFGRTGELNVRAGGLAGDKVLQMQYRVGGPQTVRGFEYGERRGNAFWSAQLDIGLKRRGILSPVIFADIGDATFTDSDPLIGVGGGVSLLQGFMRLNLSKGLEPDRDLRLDLLFRAPR
jgi:hypothetical protein